MTDHKLPTTTTIAAAAKQLGVSSTALRRDLSESGVRCWFFCGAWRVGVTSLLEWLDSRPGDPAVDDDRWRAHRDQAAQSLPASVRQGIRGRRRRKD